MNGDFAVGRGGCEGSGRPLVDALGDMVAMTVMDRDGRITFVSGRWCQMTGWRREEVENRHWTAVGVHPDDLPAARRAGRQAVSRGMAIKFDSRIVSRDGETTTWVQSHVSPLRDDGGEVVEWLLVALDLTDYRSAVEALRRSERRFQVILSSSNDVVSILEPDGGWRATWSSAPWLRGFRRSDVADGWLHIVHPDDRERSMSALDRIADRGRGPSEHLYEGRVLLPDGSVRWLETSAVNLVDDLAVGGIVLHTRDVSERHRAQAELLLLHSRLEALVDNMPIGVQVTDEEGRVVAINRAFLDTLGIDAEPGELMGEQAERMEAHYREVWADPEGEVARLRDVTQARVAVTDMLWKLASGRTVGVALVPIEAEGTHLGHMCLTRDVSEELAVAAEREYLLEMEKRQNARLTELDAIKNGMIASMSHELRTPLTSIVSFTQLLRDGLGADGDPELSEFLDIIGRNTDRLLRLVDDLMLLDRLESNSVDMTLEPVDIGTLVSLAVASARPMVAEAGLTISCEVAQGWRLQGDVGRIGQLIDNLVANAVKFTPAGGCVTVTAQPFEDHWEIRVADTGIGIPSGERELLFQRFFRASNARRSGSPGSGLGLAIVRGVAELHRGSVTVTSEEGSGTTVTAVLRDAPLQTSPISPLGSAVEQEVGSTGLGVARTARDAAAGR